MIATPDYGPGDFVRCVCAAGWHEGPFPLTPGHVYQVRAVEPAQPGDPYGVARLHLHGFPSSFMASRFDLVARAAANDDPYDAAAIPQLMARVMREQEASYGQCTVDDLARAGFSAAQIVEYGDEARQIARRSCAPGEVA